ncbi:MAG: hypothetical protein WC738_00645 [Candidatus Omnitrophota bacterium]|jgi:hypothetical protein
MKKNIRKYIITAITVAAVVIVFFLAGKHGRYAVNKFEIKKISHPILPRSEVPERVIYSINDVKKPLADGPAEKVNDLESMYKKYPKERAGINMIEEWSKVKPEDKAEMAKGITGAIKESEEKLMENPDDKRAKSKLIISQMLQKLMASNFNYKIKEQEAGDGR